MKLQDLKRGMVVASNVGGVVYKGIVENLADEKTKNDELLVIVKLQVPFERKTDYLPSKNGDLVMFKLSKCIGLLQNA